MEILAAIANAIGIGKWLEKYINPKPEVLNVNLKYPEETGIKEKVEAEGLTIAWASEKDVQGKIDNEGYQNIFKHPKTGKPIILRVEDRINNLILVKRPKT